MGNVSCCASNANPKNALYPTNPKNALYPMWVMHVDDALGLKAMTSHQALRDAGKVVEREDGMIVIFISHQWLGSSHPDKHMRQFAVLQAALRALINGLTVAMCPFTSAVFSQLESYLTPAEGNNLSNAYIWYDYFSIPQITIRDEEKVQNPSTILAVESIPAYVVASDHFFVLAPMESHEDTKSVVNLETWGRRGWCRAEMGFHYFSGKEKPSVIVITKPDRVVETFPFAWLHNQPIHGAFTVGADRQKVAKLMGQVCKDRIAMLKQKGKEFDTRFLTAMLPWLKGSDERIVDLTQWLEMYGFTSPTQAGSLGWAPVHFAALEGNLKILEKLIASGESVNRKTEEGDGPPLNTIDVGMQIPGMTPLMCAAFYIPTGKDSVKVAKLLLEQKADLHMKCAGNETALHLAAAGAASDSKLTKFLVRSGADMEKINDAKETPLLKACFFCPAGSKFPNFRNVRALVHLGSKMTNAASVRPIHPTPLRVACGTGMAEDIKFLLDHGAEPDGKNDYLTKPVDFEMTCFPIYIRESSIKACTEHLYGGTPLHWAAFFGNTVAVHILKAYATEAILLLKNYQGRTAAEVAKHEGHKPEVIEAFQIAEDHEPH